MFDLSEQILQLNRNIFGPKVGEMCDKSIPPISTSGLTPNLVVAGRMFASLEVRTAGLQEAISLNSETLLYIDIKEDTSQHKS